MVAICMSNSQSQLPLASTWPQALHLYSLVISWPEETLIKQKTYVSVGGWNTGTNALHNICKCVVLKIRAFEGTAYGLSYAPPSQRCKKRSSFDSNQNPVPNQQTGSSKFQIRPHSGSISQMFCLNPQSSWSRVKHWIKFVTEKEHNCFIYILQQASNTWCVLKCVIPWSPTAIQEASKLNPQPVCHSQGTASREALKVTKPLAPHKDSSKMPCCFLGFDSYGHMVMFQESLWFVHVYTDVFPTTWNIGPHFHTARWWTLIL